jgi:heme/copper-type cytochrome/quinol oxidase subunit 2
MTYKFFVWGVRILVLVAFFSLSFSVFCLNPYSDLDSFQEINLINILLFDLSIFLFLFGMFSLFLFKVRKSRLSNPKTRELNAVVGISVRQGFLLALIFLILLIMQSFRVLVWWDGLLVVGGVILVELYFLIR